MYIYPAGHRHLRANGCSEMCAEPAAVPESGTTSRWSRPHRGSPLPNQGGRAQAQKLRPGCRKVCGGVRIRAACEVPVQMLQG